MQNRLARKADNKLAYSKPETATDSLVGKQKIEDFNNFHAASLSHSTKPANPVFLQQEKVSVASDPALEQIVARLKSGMELGNTSTNIPSFSMKTENQHVPSKFLQVPSTSATSTCSYSSNTSLGTSCICLRPLKLVLCQVCDEMFPARVSRVCSVHPRAVYLQDVKECKGCKQTNKEALKEFE